MGNTVGSLTEEQQSIITGKLLGDGSLRKKDSTLLEVIHSHHQKDYVFWLYEKLRNLVRTPPKRREFNNRISYRFTTLSFVELNSFYERFYEQKEYKSIPNDLKLNPLTLAVWFMDDGSKDRDSIYFNTQQFDVDDQKILLSKLEELGLSGALNRDKKYFRIRLYKKCVEKFKKITLPHMLQSMHYKFP